MKNECIGRYAHFFVYMVKTCKLVLYENNAFYKPKKCRQRFCGLKKNLQICVVKIVNED